jgi:hypothetical protein
LGMVWALPIEALTTQLRQIPKLTLFPAINVVVRGPFPSP